MKAYQVLSRGMLIGIYMSISIGCNQEDSIRKDKHMNIFAAIQQHNEALVDSLLENNPCLVDIEDNQGCTPLFWAVSTGQVRIASSLLFRGAQVDSIESQSGVTPLMIAVQSNNIEMVKLLLDSGASTTIQDYTGRTPLHHATDSGFEEIVELLILQGADLEARDNLGRTPLHYAILHYCKHYVYGHLGTVNVLVSRKADVQARDAFGKTPLEYSENFSQTGVCRHLLAKEIDVALQEEYHASKQTNDTFLDLTTEYN